MNSELLLLGKLLNNCSGYDNRALGAGSRAMPGALGNRVADNCSGYIPRIVPAARRPEPRSRCEQMLGLSPDKHPDFLPRTPITANLLQKGPIRAEPRRALRRTRTNFRVPDPEKREFPTPTARFGGSAGPARRPARCVSPIIRLARYSPL